MVVQRIDDIPQSDVDVFHLYEQTVFISCNVQQSHHNFPSSFLSAWFYQTPQELSGFLL